MQKKKAEEKDRRQDKRTIYFVIGHAHFWAKLHIAKIEKCLAKKMAYRRFTNLREKFRGDLVAK
eukprot:3649880-Ditylum_brightwellii.AAC.1